MENENKKDLEKRIENIFLIIVNKKQETFKNLQDLENLCKQLIIMQLELKKYNG